MLDTTRYYKPSRELLDKLEEGEVLFPTEEIDDSNIQTVLIDQPEGVILTVSKKAAIRVNRVALQTLFTDAHQLGEIPYDSELGTNSAYQGMKVLITQNRNKENGVVNGQPATLMYRENTSLFLKHINGYICCIHPVTQRDEEGERTVVYPITPAYASTITKMQGQNMKKIMLWLDCQTVPNGSTYVALSRITKHADLLFMHATQQSQYEPV